MRFDFQSRYTDLYFTTATVKGWKHLLKPDKYKQVIMDSMSFLTSEDSTLSIALYTDEVVWQKMNYIHRNPVQPKWGLSQTPEAYVFSSAAFYATKDTRWPFLTHFWYGDDRLTTTEQGFVDLSGENLRVEVPFTNSYTNI